VNDAETVGLMSSSEFGIVYE